MSRATAVVPTIAAYELPPANLKRWNPHKKELVVLAVSQGVLTTTEALSRYALSLEEFLSWCDLYRAEGRKGLSTLRQRRRQYDR